MHLFYLQNFTLLSLSLIFLHNVEDQVFSAET